MKTKHKWHAWNTRDPGSLRWSGEYADHIDRPMKPRKGPRHVKRKNK